MQTVMLKAKKQYIRLKDNLLPLSLILSIPIINVIYELINNSHRGVHYLTTDIDRTIPFLKVFILPYISWYFFIFACLFYFCFKEKDVYYKTLVAVNVSLLVCYLVYFSFQTSVPRPALAGSDILSRLTSLVYRYDRPFNCFPSIHCITSYLMIKAVDASTIKNLFAGLAVKAEAVLVIASTLFVKQHIIVDAVSAIFLGNLIFKMVDSLKLDRFLLREARLHFPQLNSIALNISKILI